MGREIYEVLSKLNKDKLTPKLKAIITRAKLQSNAREIFNALYETQDNQRETIIHLLVKKEFRNILEYLLELKDNKRNGIIDLNVKNSNNLSPLFFALQKTKTNMVYVFLEHVKNIFEFSIPHSDNPQELEYFLHFLCRAPREKCSVRVLNKYLKHNSEIKKALGVKNHNGETPLMLACAFGHFWLAREIIESIEVDLEAKNNKGERIDEILDAYEQTKKKFPINIVNMNSLREKIKAIREEKQSQDLAAIQYNENFFQHAFYLLSLQQLQPLFYLMPQQQPLHHFMLQPYQQFHQPLGAQQQPLPSNALFSYTYPSYYPEGADTRNNKRRKPDRDDDRYDSGFQYR